MPAAGSQLYADSVFEAIIERVGDGELILKILEDPGMPGWRQFYEICGNVGGPYERPVLSQAYAQARIARHNKLAAEIELISEADPLLLFSEVVGEVPGSPDVKAVVIKVDSGAVQHQKLRVDTRKWLVSKMLPREYGDKLQALHTGGDGGPITYAPVVHLSLTQGQTLPPGALPEVIQFPVDRQGKEKPKDDE